MAGEKVRLNVWVLVAQHRDLQKACEVTGLSKTEAVGEALQYWLTAQRKMGVFDADKVTTARLLQK